MPDAVARSINDWGQGIAALAMLCACCAGSAHAAQRFVEQSAEVGEPAAPQAEEEYDLEGQQFRIMSLSRNQDGLIVASRLDGEELICIAEPPEKQSHVLLDKIARALHTDPSQLSLYESDRCVGYSDVVQDMNLLTLRQSLPRTESALAAHKMGFASVDMAPTVRMMQMRPVSVIPQVVPPAFGTRLQSEANATKQVVGPTIKESMEDKQTGTSNQAALIETVESTLIRSSSCKSEADSESHPI
jgi:hypothetical protein